MTMPEPEVALVVTLPPIDVLPPEDEIATLPAAEMLAEVVTAVPEIVTLPEFVVVRAELIDTVAP